MQVPGVHVLCGGGGGEKDGEDYGLAVTGMKRLENLDWTLVLGVCYDCQNPVGS